MDYKIAFLGFGNVGKALAKLLLRKKTELKQAYDISITVTGIFTKSHGSAINCHGIDLEAVLEQDNLFCLEADLNPADAFEFIRQCSADVLFENTPVNYQTGQPAANHLKMALEQGMHAITANKGPVVHAYQELTSLAKTKGRKFFFESTVMDGAPIFSLFRDTIPCANLLSINGVLNSTTNMMLSRMELGESFNQAIDYCQKIGVAETDPSGDIDGWDAAVKIAALATVLMRTPVKPAEVERTGIRNISPEQVAKARQDGKRYKLVCSARKIGDKVLTKVAPQLVGVDSPMFGVEGTTSIVQFETDVLGLLSIVEADPGPHTTAYGLLADFLNAVRER